MGYGIAHAGEAALGAVRIGEPARQHEVEVVLLGVGQQHRRQLRRMLEVAVHDDGPAGFGGCEAGEDRAAEPTVTLAGGARISPTRIAAL